MDFDKLLRKYVWDDEKTPYFTPARQLTRRQAHYELIAYGFFLGILFSAVSFIFLTGAAGQAKSFPAALFAFLIVCGAAILAFTRTVMTGNFLVLAPVGGISYLLVNGVRPSWGTIDVVFISLMLLAWLAYAWRVIAVCRRFSEVDDA